MSDERAERDRRELELARVEDEIDARFAALERGEQVEENIDRLGALLGQLTDMVDAAAARLRPEDIPRKINLPLLRAMLEERRRHRHELLRQEREQERGDR